MVENICTCHHIRPVEILQEVIEQRQLIALSTIDQSSAVARTVPQNEIVLAQIIANEEGQIEVSNIRPVLSSSTHPTTEDGLEVIGYEDPTLIDEKANPFSNQRGFLATQVYKNPEHSYGVWTNLVYAQYPIYIPQTVITPNHARKYQLAPYIDMIKEGELLENENLFHLFFEFAGGPSQTESSSNIAIGKIEDQKVVTAKRFLTIDKTLDGNKTEHLSTGSAPLKLSDGRLLMFFNRRVRNEWGISYMIKDNHKDSSQLTNWKIYPEWIIRAPKSMGEGHGNQRIAFASCAQMIATNPTLIQIFFHINDLKQYEAIIEVNK